MGKCSMTLEPRRRLELKLTPVLVSQPQLDCGQRSKESKYRIFNEAWTEGSTTVNGQQCAQCVSLTKHMEHIMVVNQSSYNSTFLHYPISFDVWEP